MAVGVTATLRIQEGKEGELEGIFADLGKAVRANEPGNRLYTLCRSRKDKNTYVVMEIYDSDDAMKAHGRSDHFRAASPKIGATLAGPPDIQAMDIV